MIEPLRVGVAGLGIASSYALPVFASHPRVRLTAVADPRPEALRRAASELGVGTFESIDELCFSDPVDVVYVATPNFLHEQHVLCAIERGKHVIVEKPMGISIDQCLRMAEAADRAGVQIVCGHTHSFNPPIRALHELAKGGTLGRLRMVNAWNYTDLLYRARADWELDTSKGGGVVFIQAPHQIDISRLIGGGLLRSVRASAASWDSSRHTEGAFSAFLEFEDGATATLVYSGYAHFDSAEFHDWIGERGQPRDPAAHLSSRASYKRQLEAGRAEAELRDARRYGGSNDRGGSAEPGQGHQFFGPMIFSFERADVRQSPSGLMVYGDDRTYEVDVPTAPGGAWAMIEELCDAVATGQPAPHDGCWGAATVEVCDAILESARTHREVLLSHQVAYRG